MDLQITANHGHLSDHSSSRQPLVAPSATLERSNDLQLGAVRGSFTPIPHEQRRLLKTEPSEESNDSPLYKTVLVGTPKKLEPNDITLTVIQQPEKARVCGFSVTDRRPIHPPPVIKLSGSGISESSSLVMFASLWSRDLQQNVTYSHKAGPKFAYTPASDESEEEEDDVISNQDCSAYLHPVIKRPRYNVGLAEGYTSSMVLMGQLISECSKLTDTSGENGLYFVYNDLAVRSSGFYRLKFELYQMSNVLRGSSPLAVVYSGQFQAFSPKSFPGLTHPTALSLCFARQGVSIRMRSTASGHGSGRVKRNRDDDEDD